LYNIHIEFSIHYDNGKVKKMCPNETYTTDRVGKYWSDIVFRIRNNLTQ